MDTFQIILISIIAVVFVAMILLLFVGKKSSKKNTKNAEKAKDKAEPVATDKKAEPAKDEPVKEEKVEAEPVKEEKTEEAPKEEKKEEPKEEPVVEEKPAAAESTMISAKEITLEVGKKYVVGKDIKAGVYKLETLNEAKTADINLYGLDVSYNNGEKLVLANDDELIAKSPIKIKK